MSYSSLRNYLQKFEYKNIYHLKLDNLRVQVKSQYCYRSYFNNYFVLSFEDTGSEKPKIKAYAHKKDKDGDETHYESNFNVPEDFGEVGAITIENEHHKEMFVESIVIDGVYGGPINVTCNSWIHSKFDNKEPRVFFVDKVSLCPSRHYFIFRYIHREIWFQFYDCLTKVLIKF